MDIFIIMIIIIPATLFWAGYLYYKDRYQSEPALGLLFSYGFGIGAGFLSVYFYIALEFFGLRYDPYELAQTNQLGLLLYSVFVIGVNEELVKFLSFWLIVTHSRHFNELIDGIIYASFVALGFATYENIHYLQFLEGYEALARAIASPLVHIMFASIWGYAYSWAYIHNYSLWLTTVIGLALAFLAHGFYDFGAISLSEWIHIVPPAIILIIWLWRLLLIEKLHQKYQTSFTEKNVPVKLHQKYHQTPFTERNIPIKKR
jgi:RsiW-degrading membrane proteinase PrsW (M82 family)